MASSGDPLAIPQMLAYHMLNTATNASGLTVDNLTPAIQEVTVRTQTCGAALLQLTLIDPAWKIQRSGLCDVDSDGLLQQIDVNFPTGTPVWWRMSMIDGGSDLSDANLTLTFQQRIISYLQNDFGGNVTAAPGTTTLAQFVKQLAGRIPNQLPTGVRGPSTYTSGPVCIPTGKPGDSQSIKFVCPEVNINELNEAQSINLQTGQIFVSALYGSPTSNGVDQSSTSAFVQNKAGGVPVGTGLTVKGIPINSTQANNAATLLAVGKQLKAPAAAYQAIIYAAMGETNLGMEGMNSPNSAGAIGILQGTDSYWKVASNRTVANMANSFYKGGYGFNNGGAIALANAGMGAEEIAIKVEVPSIWPADAYASEWNGGSAQGLKEALDIVNAWGGAGGTGAITDTTTSSALSLDATYLARGTTDNPDEDSFSCMQRIAGQTNWSLFSSPYEGGVWGNYLYFIDGPTMDTQLPVLYLGLDDTGTIWTATEPIHGKSTSNVGDGVVTDLTYTFDNTAYIYQSERKRKGKTMRATRIRTPQSPAQVRFNIYSGVMNINAGQTIQFKSPKDSMLTSMGPLDGVWIVSDTTQNALHDLYAQVTLEPPQRPNPSPTTSTSVTPVSGKATQADGFVAGASTTISTARLNGHPGNVTPAIARLVNVIIDRFPKMEITCTTDHHLDANGTYHLPWTLPPGTPGYEAPGSPHLGEAIDISCSDYGYMNQCGQWISQTLGNYLTEGIHDPGSSVVSGGVQNTPYGTVSWKFAVFYPNPYSIWGSTTWGEHINHIHIACAGKQATAILNDVHVGNTGTGSTATKVTKAVSTVADQVTESIGGIFGTMFEKQSGATDPTSADYVPNATYIPGIGTNK